MPLLGRETPALSALMAASSHLVILPAKMPARVAGDSLSVLTLERLYSTATPPAIQGICITAPAPPVAVAWSPLSGASDPAKSTVFDVSCWMPAPEPTPV